MQRNLFLFTDGTGNAGGKSRNTNVYRLFNAIDRDNKEVKQLTFYDDGVGTSDNAVSRALGGAFGAGLSRNIRELYLWLIRHYDHDSPEGEEDRIFVFGFSRGAFTARCLAGLVNRCGILKKTVWDGLPAAERKERLRRIVWAYRAASDEKFAEWRGNPDHFTPVRIHFVGVWDTVDAVGMPIDELRPLFDWAFRLLAKRRAYGFHDMELSGVEHARHAIAIDDERRTFHPNVWHKNPTKKRGTEPVGVKRPTDPANIRQVWFAGAHSNVGGGYPKDQVAHVTLDWMMGELEHLADIDGTPVKLLEGRRKSVQDKADELGRVYDPRTGFAVYYRYSPRRLAWFYKGTDDFWVRRLLRRKAAALPRHGIEIHASAFQRIEDGAQSYAPLFMSDPDDADFKLSVAFTEQGGPYSAQVATLGDLPKRVADAAAQVSKAVHSMVLTRQAAYAVFLGATLFTLYRGLSAGAAVYETTAGAEREILWGMTLGDAAVFLKGLIPDLLSGLIDAAFANPGRALLYIVVVTLSGVLSLRLKSRIGRTARKVYDDVLGRIRGPDEAG